MLLDVRSRKLLFMEGATEAREWLAPPGSTVKPLSLWALLRSGRVKPDDSILCPRYLRLGGISMNCSHPRLPFPVNASRAIAYSCNCATAHFAKRFRDDQLAQFYREFGLGSPTRLLPAGEAVGQITQGALEEQRQLQALGERGVRVTVLEMAEAYRHVATLAHTPAFQPILEGLEGAVQFGAGRAAQVPGRTVAGKTGSVQTESGPRAAWFAGFTPSRDPQVVVTVLTQGSSGADAAAPVAGQLLRHYFSTGKP